MERFIILDLVTLLSVTMFSCNCFRFYKFSEDPSCKGKVGTIHIELRLQNVSLVQCVNACDQEAKGVQLTYDKLKKECNVQSFALDDLDMLGGLVANVHGTCFRDDGLVEQWITNVIAASNQQGPYLPSYIKGYRDRLPWIALKNTTAFIEVEVEHEVFMEYIFIYELGNSIAFSEISVRDPDGNWVSVWTGPQIPISPPERITNRLLSATNFKTKALRFDIYQVPEPQKIDAVRVMGRRVQRSKDL